MYSDPQTMLQQFLNYHDGYQPNVQFASELISVANSYILVLGLQRSYFWLSSDPDPSQGLNGDGMIQPPLYRLLLGATVSPSL